MRTNRSGGFVSDEKRGSPLRLNVPTRGPARKTCAGPLAPLHAARRQNPPPHSRPAWGSAPNPAGGRRPPRPPGWGRWPQTPAKRPRPPDGPAPFRRTGGPYPLPARLGLVGPPGRPNRAPPRRPSKEGPADKKSSIWPGPSARKEENTSSFGQEAWRQAGTGPPLRGPRYRMANRVVSPTPSPVPKPKSLLPPRSSPAGHPKSLAPPARDFRPVPQGPDVRKEFFSEREQEGRCRTSQNTSSAIEDF